jgi:Flp pilus assembly protein TadG
VKAAGARTRVGALRRLHGRRDESGVAMVELAIVLPVLALLLFGLLDVGRLVYVNNAASQGAREGSRWGSVAGRSNTATERAAVEAKTASLMTGVPAATVTVTCERDGGTTSSCRSGDVLVVRVETRVDMFTPLIGQIVGGVDLTSTSRVAVQQ